MKNTVAKMLTALLLVVILCASILPSAAFAADDDVQDDDSSVSEQVEEMSDGEENDETPAAEEDDETPADEEDDEISADEENDEISGDEENDEISGDEEDEEISADEEDEEVSSAPQMPEMPTAPQAPEMPDVSGLSPEEANVLIEDYNAQVDTFNAEAETYNQAMELYEQEVAAYNEQAEAYNAEALIYNEQVDEHNEEEIRLQAESDARMAEYEARLSVYERNVATLKTIDERNSALAQTQAESLGDIHRVDRESVLELGTVLEEPYYVGYGRFQRAIGQPGDLVISWDDLAPTTDRNTITIEAGEASGKTYKVANQHIFDDYSSFAEKNEYLEENGYDCMNIEFDDENGCIIIPRALIDRMVMMEVEVAEADANDTVTVISQNTLFSSSALFTLSRYMDGYTQGRYWYTGETIFATNAANYDVDSTLTGHTFDFIDGTSYNEPIKNVLNVNMYTCFARYSNPQPVKPEEHTAQLLQHTELIDLMDVRPELMGLLIRMDLLDIPEVSDESETVVTEDEPSVSETETTVTEPEAPITETSTAVIENETPVPESNTSAVEPEAPAQVEAPAQSASSARPVNPVQGQEAAPMEEPEKIADDETPLAASEEKAEPEDHRETEIVSLTSENGSELRVENLAETLIPASAPSGSSWALLNLIAAILSALTGLWMALHAGEKRADDTRCLNRLLSVLPAACTVLVYALICSFRGTMVLTDRWTPLMLILLGVTLGVSWLTWGSKRQEKQEA